MSLDSLGSTNTDMIGISQFMSRNIVKTPTKMPFSQINAIEESKAEAE